VPKKTLVKTASGPWPARLFAPFFALCVALDVDDVDVDVVEEVDVAPDVVDPPLPDDEGFEVAVGEDPELDVVVTGIILTVAGPALSKDPLGESTETVHTPTAILFALGVAPPQFWITVTEGAMRDSSMKSDPLMAVPVASPNPSIVALNTAVVAVGAVPMTDPPKMLKLGTLGTSASSGLSPFGSKSGFGGLSPFGSKSGFGGLSPFGSKSGFAGSMSPGFAEPSCGLGIARAMLASNKTMMLARIVI